MAGTELSPEQFEQARRKQLEELQQLATKFPEQSPLWKKVFRRRSPSDNKATDWPYEAYAKEILWLPVDPYETMLQMSQRIQRAYGQAAQHEVCEHCRINAPLKWGGFGPNGRHIWLHDIQVANESTWMDRLAERLGYSKPTESHPETIVCRASGIIRAFQLVAVPATSPGVNMGAYPPHPQPYGDPSIPGTANEEQHGPQTPAGGNE